MLAHLPDVLQVVWPQVLVLQVVRVLPHVDAQQRRQPLQQIMIVQLAAPSDSCWPGLPAAAQQAVWAACAGRLVAIAGS